MRLFIALMLRSTLTGISQVFLQCHRGCGLLILVAIGLHDAFLLAGALIGQLSGSATAWHCRYARSDIETGLYGYNGALLGLLITSTLSLSLPAGLLIVFTGALSSLLQQQLLRRMREHTGPPGFTLAFVLCGWGAMTLCGLLEGVVEARLPAYSMDSWGALNGMLRGVGQVLFLPDPIAGLCLFGALLLANRRAAVWSLCGSAVGIYVALLMGASEEHSMAGLAGYNPALAALALSQMHRSVLAPALGIVLAISGRLAFEQLGLPPLTMPFILACWAAIGVIACTETSSACSKPDLNPR